MVGEVDAMVREMDAEEARGVQAARTGMQMKMGATPPRASPAFVEGTAAVLDAEVHTKQCAAWSADNTTRYGSDHYPVSVDFELHPNQ